MAESMIGLILDTAIRASLLFAVAWIVTAAMNRRSAAERHAVWLLAISGAVLLPTLVAMSPRLTVAPPSIRAVTGVSVAVEHWLAAPIDAEATAIDTGVAAQPDRPAASQVFSVAEPTSRWTLARLICAIYLAGALALAARYAVMRMRLARHLRGLPACHDTALAQRVEAIRRRFGIDREVRLLFSDHDHSPWAWGSMAPRLVLPRAFTGWSVEQQDAALLHELSHIGRHDHLAGLLAQLTCVIHWFNPLAWFAVHRMRLEAEKACDDRVVSAGKSACAYAQQLLEIASRVFERKTHSVWIPAMAHRSGLTPRIRAILDPNKRRSEMSPHRRAVYSLIACFVVLPLAALHSQEAAEDLNDPEFLRLVTAGPVGSAELERIVDAYLHNEMNDAAADAIARFVVGEYGTADDRRCDFCIEVFASEATPRQHPHFDAVIAAFELIAARAEADGSGDRLLNAAIENIVRSGNARAMNRATYYVMRSTQIGIDAALNIEVVSFLYEQGNVTAARELAAWLHDNEGSAHYQSEATGRWLNVLDAELQRRASLAQVIFDSLGAASASPGNDYLPVLKTPPVYPQPAADAGIEGHVVVEFTVDATGRTANVSVVSSTNSLFNESALAAARQFRYAPRMVAGAPVEVPGVRNRITYKLDL